MTDPLKEKEKKEKKNNVEKFLEQAGEHIDPIGKAIFGKSLWRDVGDIC